MTNEQMNKHVGHELTVGIVEANGEPTGELTLDCWTCDETIESTRRTD